MKLLNAEDINIDEYLSDDEIPDYKTQANNYSADDEEKTNSLCIRNIFYSTFNKSIKYVSI